MIITDAQVHVWQAHSAERPWPPEYRDNPVFLAVEGAHPHRAEPISADEMVAMMDAAGVHRAIIVPPSPVGDSNLCALEAVARYPTRFAVMGRFNPLVPNAHETLAGWLQQPGMAGIRMTFHKAPWNAWLDDGRLDIFWADCERLGIPLMLLIPDRLDAVRRVAERHPDLQLVIDHMGLRSNARDDAGFAGLDQLFALAKCPNVSVKTSAAPCYSSQRYPFANLTLHLRRIYEHFGPMRTFWGSDVSRLPCTYREAVQHFTHELDFIAPADLPWVMGSALSRLLRWPEPEGV